MVNAYIRALRASAKPRRREYLTALRRETAKFGRDADLVEFDCMLLCTICGHLSEPRVGDPMRTEASFGPSSCAMCSAPGLLDLRQTELVHSLSALESTDVNPSRAWAIGKIFGMVGVAGGLALLGSKMLLTLGSLAGGFLVAGLAVIGTALIARAASSMLGPASRRRSLPRRWRWPRTSKRRGSKPHRRVGGRAETSAELLRAPLSGRSCVAYEVAVRDDDDATGELSSWRLIEQDNVGFRVGELEVAAGEALLRVRRELLGAGTIGSKDDATRRYLRMRGLLDSEDVHIYETIVAPDSACTISRSDADAPVLVRS